MKRFFILLFITSVIFINSCFAYENYNFKYSFWFNIPSWWYEFTKEEFNNFSAIVSSNWGNRTSTPVTFLKHTNWNVMNYPFIVVTYSNAEWMFKSWEDLKSEEWMVDVNSLKKDFNNLSTTTIKLSKVEADYLIDDKKQAVILLTDASYNNWNSTQQVTAMFYKNSHFVNITLYTKAWELDNYLSSFYSIINSFYFNSSSKDLRAQARAEESTEEKKLTSLFWPQEEPEQKLTSLFWPQEDEEVKEEVNDTEYLQRSDEEIAESAREFARKTIDECSSSGNCEVSSSPKNIGAWMMVLLTFFGWIVFIVWIVIAIKKS